MTLQSTPPISAGDINVELGRARTAPFDINGTAERKLAGKTTGPISFSDFLGKSSVTPGSRTFNSSGTFTVPAYNTLSVTVDGGGGGGGSTTYVDINSQSTFLGLDGTAGGFSRFSFSGTPPTANGGQPGKGAGLTTNGSNGAAGSGSGGTVTSGGGGSGGNGGDARTPIGGDGGAGGRVVKSWTSGGPTAGSNVTITVGGGGAGGQIPGGSEGGESGSPGTAGRVTITWS